MNRPDGKPVSSYVAEAWERVREVAVPDSFVGLFPDTNHPVARTGQKRRLAMLCGELARERPNGWFGLSQIDAAAILGVDQSAVSAWLREFVRLGLMVRTHRGSQKSGRASRYEWVFQNDERAGGRAATSCQRTRLMTPEQEVRLAVAVELIRAAGGDAWSHPERIADAVGIISERVLRPEPVKPAPAPPADADTDSTTL